MENPHTKTTISNLGNDVLQAILSKLPAHSFASAACVNHGWNHVSARILSRPIIVSAVSLNVSPPEAMKEVMDKVFAAPIRPHFAILCVSPTIDLDLAHESVKEKLGSKVPIITCESGGIIGRDALSNQFREVTFSSLDIDITDDSACHVGVSLTVGYIPGLKVDAIPLLLPVEGSSINKFVMDIRDYSASASGGSYPEAILMFQRDFEAGMKPFLNKLDYGLAEQTLIAGNGSCRFKYQSIANTEELTPRLQRNDGESCCAVALVFARDKTMNNGPVKIEFHFAMGAGVTAVGPTYKVVSTRNRSRICGTLLSARQEGGFMVDGEQMLRDIETEMDPHFQDDLYIGVTKRRRVSIGSEKSKPVTFLSYHPLQHPLMHHDMFDVCVGGVDIKTGDSFRFYVPDPSLALLSSGTVSENFGSLKHKEVVGGFVFACCGRDRSFLDEPNANSAPILDNFPVIPLTGMFCGAEIGCGPSVAQPNLENGGAIIRNSSHVYSSIYVLMCCSRP